MAVESGARASNTLTGDLRSRPLAVLLAGAAERGASGTFTFRHGTRCDKLTMRVGKIAVVRTTEPVAYLGGVLYELGAIDITALNQTLHYVASAKQLHGNVLVEAGLVTRDRIDEGLAEQTLRQVHHLFSLPEETKWSFREDQDELAGARDDGRPAVEAWQAIWRGLRDQPAAGHIRRTLAKIDGGIHLRDLRSIEKLGLAPEERAICQRLHAQPALLETLVATSGLAVERTQLLVYLLALARCIVRVEIRPVGPVELGADGVRLRAARIDGEDPYTTLGLRSGASVEAARAAFFRLARLWHPDKIPAALDEVRAECQHVFVRLGAAHRTITDLGGRIDMDALFGAGNAAAANDSVAPPPQNRITLRDADAALARNDIARAEAIASSLTSAGADGPAARAVLAWCAAGAGTSADPAILERGIASLDKLLTGDPDCVRALFFRAQLSKRLGRADAALRDYRKVVRLDPRHVDAQREVHIADRALLATPSAPVASPATDEPGHEDTSLVTRAGLRRLFARVSGGT